MNDDEEHQAERYVDLGLIAAGGMGEVRRVRDVELNRVMAMKVLHPDLLASPGALERFVEEAQATAQLQHPHIVPVHELGRLPDGRVYFTMQEVRGRTLTEVIAQVHAASRGVWRRTEAGWSLARLIEVLRAVTEAVAYAHRRGVVHRDLKPDNIMVGDLGEVHVVDWGIAKVAGPAERAVPRGESVVTARSHGRALDTRDGTVIGTPAYMAPEQARGDIDRITGVTDVYALGAVLYHVLSGRPPYTADHAVEVLAALLDGPPASVRTRAEREGLAAPEALVEICERAMARDPADRYPRAEDLADALRSWLDGSASRARALTRVRRAASLAEQAGAADALARAHLAEAQASLETLAPSAPESEKLAAWVAEEAAEEAALRANLLRFEREQLLLGALMESPDLPEAHAALAEDYRAGHAAAEAAGDRPAVARLTRLLEHHLRRLPHHHPAAAGIRTYLGGEGSLTLHTEPPGADVALYEYVNRHGRLVAEPRGAVGTTPLRRLALPMGSYLAVLSHPGRAQVRYPVHVARGRAWEGVRPGDSEPTPVWLPPASEVGPEDCVVAAGWFRAGGRGELAAVPPGELWCDDFVIRRFPVTNREYVAFLDDLVLQGRAEEADLHVPRERGAASAGPGAPIYGRTPTGGFELRPDADGDIWLADAPVLMVDWFGAAAYAAWLAERTGRPWRLPWDLEWEKAARGVDGRPYPWGSRFDPTYCCVRESHVGRRLPQVVESYPLDVSPYEVRGLGGNVRDWCADVWVKRPPDGDPLVRPYLVEGVAPMRVDRGGYWDGPKGNVLAMVRLGDYPAHRASNLGFRVARSLARP